MPTVQKTILVIDDQAPVRLSLAVLLEDHNFQVLEAENPQLAQMVLKEHQVQLILLDMNYQRDTTSGQEGLDFLSWLQASDITIPVVVMTAWANVELAVNAMQLGAKDFIEKPWKNQRLMQIIEQQLELGDLQQQNQKLKQLNQRQSEADVEYQWVSESMKALYQQLATVAEADVPILLTGSNGTGKTQLAKWIHNQSKRHEQPFVSVNMGAISENLFESEMFGHSKGAFTDAKESRIGRFELAETGSLFLDEIANIPLSQQAKLLRVLESGEYEVLGSSQTRRADVRLISATNGDFTKLIAEEKFREDLFYRMNTLSFRVPDLSERTDDIVPLAQFYIANFCHKYSKPELSLTECARQALLNYAWPGNLREMSHLLERAVLLSSGTEIAAAQLALNQTTAQFHSAQTNSQLPMMTLEQAEINLIKQALGKTQGNVPKAAVLLGLTKSSLYRRVEKYELD